MGRLVPSARQVAPAVTLPHYVPLRAGRPDGAIGAKFKRAGRSANRHAPGAQRPPPLETG